MAALLNPKLMWRSLDPTSGPDYIVTLCGQFQSLPGLTCLLPGKSKHKHVFVYYQRPDVINDANELVDAKGCMFG